MGGAAFTITLDDTAWQDAAAAAARLGGGRSTELLAFLGEELYNVTMDAFDAEANPETGKAWEPWSPIYAASDRHGPKKLYRRGDLRDSITYEMLPESVVIGSNLVYALTQQYGAKKGAFGTTKKGRPIPFGDIPPRPFLGLPGDFTERVLGDPAVLELLGVS